VAVPASSRIQDEIRQQRPFPSASQEAVVSLLRTTDRVKRQLALCVEPHGLTIQQYNVLRILRGAGHEGLPTLEIAERMIEAAPGITRLLDRLEAKQFVRRERCPLDRRQVLCWIEPAGAKLLARLEAPISNADEQVLAGLSRPDLTHFIRCLDQIRAGLEGPRPAPPPSSKTRRQKQ